MPSSPEGEGEGGTPQLCLLLRAPLIGTVKSRLARQVGEARALEVYCRLLSHLRDRLPEGWPQHVYGTPPGGLPQLRALWGPQAAYAPQVPGDLGQKLAAAVAQTCARSPAPVLVMGGDCPAIDAALLGRAARLLETHPAVLGPAEDGGYYLLGLRRPCPELFSSAVHWGTGAVYAQTRAAAARAGLEVATLPVHADVDDLQGYERAVERFPELACNR